MQDHIEATARVARQLSNFYSHIKVKPLLPTRREGERNLFCLLSYERIAAVIQSYLNANQVGQKINSAFHL